MLIDTHAHLQDKELKPNIEKILLRAQQADVEHIICVGYDLESSYEAVDLARRYSQIYAVIGIHPHDARNFNESIQAKLFNLAKEPKVVAIGEIGLDFYRDLSPRDLQKRAFVEQIKMAQELNKPIVIHDRDAHQDVMDIIKQEKAGRYEGVMHCYSGHFPMALELIKQGFYISFAGPLTFKNNKKAHEVATKLPLEKILIETDCPYLTPEPFRGKLNEPAHVKYVAEKLGQIRNKSLLEIAYLTNLNARKLFKIKS